MGSPSLIQLAQLLNQLSVSGKLDFKGKNRETQQ